MSHAQAIEVIRKLPAGRRLVRKNFMGVNWPVLLTQCRRLGLVVRHAEHDYRRTAPTLN